MTDTPPQFIEGERAILGAILLDNSVMSRVLNALEPEDFYREAHRIIFRALDALLERDIPADLATLTSELKTADRLEAVGGVEVLIELMDSTPSAANVMHYVNIVREKAVLRGLIAASQQVITQCQSANGDYEECLQEVEQIALKAAQAKLPRTRNTGEPKLIKTILHDAVDEVEARYQRRISAYGLSSGFTRLDQISGGFRPGELIVVAGRPGMGKTAFALAWADRASYDQITTVLFSLEMDERQNAQRLLSRKGAVNLRHVRTGQLASWDFDRLITAAGDLSEAPLWIDDSSTVSPAQIRFRIRSLQMRHKIQVGLIVVDYLQIMSPSRRQDSREQTIASISREMKQCARDLKCPVILLCQLNRELEKRADKRPLLSDLRESGAIEQDADVVIGLYQPWIYTQKEEDRGKAEAIVLKQRNGPTGSIDLSWVPETASFWDA